MTCSTWARSDQIDTVPRCSVGRFPPSLFRRLGKLPHVSADERAGHCRRDEGYENQDGEASVVMRPSRSPAAATTSWTVPRALRAEDTAIEAG